MNDPQRSAYRLLSGTFRDADGVKHTPPATVALSDDQYRAHSNKFEPAPDGATQEREDAVSEPVADMGDGPGDDADDADGDEGGHDDVTATIPDDWPVLVQMAAAWDGDEISGNDDRETIVSFLEGLNDTQVMDLKLAADLADV